MNGRDNERAPQDLAVGLDVDGRVVPGVLEAMCLGLRSRRVSEQKDGRKRIPSESGLVNLGEGVGAGERGTRLAQQGPGQGERDGGRDARRTGRAGACLLEPGADQVPISSVNPCVLRQERGSSRLQGREDRGRRMEAHQRGGGSRCGWELRRVRWASWALTLPERDPSSC